MYDDMNEIHRADLTRGLRRRAADLVPNPQDFYVHAVVDGLLDQGVTHLADVRNMDALILSNTLAAPEDDEDTDEDDLDLAAAAALAALHLASAA
ncbi:hypothetical protein EAH68_05290 [Corynebacterium hylobatis]|uniref:Uncharacterized protein n=1 Tax=Corynebacterium hylobatis TaxID=1859290 RepID=A0A3R9ZEH2_9CORY|nr:hypothetical protein [Corynebacterium hylobatis]RSZ64408.1 hypothetical protein EAH68_05290 [Corynebacterium hylobatis]